MVQNSFQSMAFINCESMFSLLLYIFFFINTYHGYMQLYKSTFQHCVKEIRKNVLNQTENERSTGST